ncbi:hypothetical protein H6P81_007584 [Aristolochia fimbriata]|uniref:Myb/SANT-like domain-containing protein n=1 Tax=Aristolochia fimbriata TaxID=158543 RepID=A0AAV7F0P0_ARIFI|nr:hypothetical protein H6P81_007584 [Aristolochia fimbriata]
MGGRRGKEPARDGQSSERHRKKNFVWSPSDDEVMLEMLVEHVQRGSKTPDGKWREDVWEDVIPRFNALKGTKITVDNVIARMKTWRKSYTAVTILRNQKGFAWDESRKLVTADAAVWDAYVKENEAARPYRNKACPNYDQLAIVIGSSIGSLSPRQTARNHNAEDMQLVEWNQADAVGIDMDNIAESSAGCESPGEEPDQNKRPCMTSSPSRPRQRPRLHAETTDALASVVGKLSEAIESMDKLREVMETLTKLQQRNESTREDREPRVEKKEQNHHSSAHDWYEALLEIPRLDSRLKFGGMELLAKKERRETFLKLDPKERREWLEWMLSNCRQMQGWTTGDV